MAASTTSSFHTSIAITATCRITSATNLNFGNVNNLNSNVDATSTIQVTCTNTTPYNIGLDAGTAAGATVAKRKLSNGGKKINYSLYIDSARTTVWGNTIGTDTVAATGNGAAQTFVVYGRIPSQATPTGGLGYTDLITVTVTY